MDEPPELQASGRWRTAVWALRVGYVGLAIVVAGLVVLSSASWVLAAGMIIWIVAAAVTATGFVWCRHELAQPRPGYLSMRWMLVHDTVRARPSPQRP